MNHHNGYEVNKIQIGTQVRNEGYNHEIPGLRLEQKMSTMWMDEVISYEVSEAEVENNKCKCVDQEEPSRIENWEKFWDTPAGQDPTFWLDEEYKEENKLSKKNGIKGLWGQKGLPSLGLGPTFVLQ